MNTPAHALINLALLVRQPADHGRSAAIVGGGLGVYLVYWIYVLHYRA